MLKRPEKNDLLMITPQEWLESIPVGVIIIDYEGKIFAFNRNTLEIFDNIQKNDSWENVLKNNVKGTDDNGHYVVSHTGKHIVVKTQSLLNKRGQIVLLFDETPFKRKNDGAITIEKLDAMGKLSIKIATQLQFPLLNALEAVSSLSNIELVRQNKEVKTCQETITKQLHIIKQQMEEISRISKGSEQFVEKLDKSYKLKKIIQEDMQTSKVITLCDQVAKTDASVLMSGESGVGKEVFAKYIHENSGRCKAPLVAINCAAIPDNMLEAMLFGYEKGAFTGAYQATEGKFESANLGTLLLDEISEMPLGLQAKLLRVIQEREVERLGGKKLIKLDIRIIATTNRNLSKEVELGKFRQDLYFRLNVFPIHIPPLRARKEDIISLANHFTQIYQIQSYPVTISQAAQEKLLSYAWPGNIRELQNVIQRAMIYANHHIIEAEHIVIESENQTVESLSTHVIDKENDLILGVLKELNGSRNDAAQKLGISTRTLRNKIARMKKMGVSISDN